jgi:hypothetical protein
MDFVSLSWEGFSFFCVISLSYPYLFSLLLFHGRERMEGLDGKRLCCVYAC